ncbi:hypothetical protein JXA32_08040 [Candidatus Sumerlaeota bacterium]|nr:hypothetical protein [Candidatus Sumerlaeota bacterium]
MERLFVPLACLILLTAGCVTQPSSQKKSTPKGTAVAFYQAAMNGDAAAIQSLCSSDAAQQAVSIGAKIKAANLPNPSWRKTNVDGGEGLQVNWGMKILSLELRNINGDWKITAIVFSEG